MVEITRRPLSRLRKKWYQLNRRLDGPQGRAESFGEDRNLLSMSEFEPWTLQSVAYP